jgi:hypothetical protein
MKLAMVKMMMMVLVIALEGVHLLPKKRKQTEDDESANLVDILKQSIAMREERESKQDSDSDRLFMLSLLEDFKKIPKHRRLGTKMEIINVIKRAQTCPIDTINSASHWTNNELFGRGYATQADYTYTMDSGHFRHGCGYSTPRTSHSGQYHRGYSTTATDRQENTPGTLDSTPETSHSEQYHRGYSTTATDRQGNTSGTLDDEFSPTGTTASDLLQDSELIDLF